MKKFLLLTWLIVCAVLAFSQNRVITGKVTTEG
ncbi:MAG: hypothetical protein JWO32_2340, partial [Bacteroidetes bacterium]|nr:hypothetical protein [Bacteroidota bacterium]